MMMNCVECVASRPFVLLYLMYIDESAHARGSRRAPLVATLSFVIASSCHCAYSCFLIYCNYLLKSANLPIALKKMYLLNGIMSGDNQKSHPTVQEALQRR